MKKTKDTFPLHPIAMKIAEYLCCSGDPCKKHREQARVIHSIEDYEREKARNAEAAAALDRLAMKKET